jgi:flagellar hook-associated protein 3
MRITDNAIVADFLANLTRSRDRINRLNIQLATQKKIQKVSDDPIMANTLLRLNTDLSRLESYKSNVVDGKSTLKMTADSLGEVADILQDVKGLLAGSTSADPSFLAKLSDQMDQFLNMSMDIANTQFDRKYIFGGTGTMAPPFVSSGAPQLVTYQGNADAIRFQVGDGISSVVNVSGAAAFASTGEINFTGVLDRAAALNTRVTATVGMTDANGVTHAVLMTMQKTGANSWEMSAAMPPGSTDATLSGGTATVTFDPATGALASVVRGSPLIVTPIAAPPAQAATPMTLMIRGAGLSEGTPPGGVSTLAGTHSGISVFNQLIALRDTLRSGVQPSADDIAMIGVMQDVIMREQARAGTLSTNLTTSDEYLTAQREHLLDLRSAKQDVDLTEIGMKLKQEEVMLDAALSAAARIIPKSLLDFLT